MINYEKGFDGYIQNIQYFDSALWVIILINY